MQSQISDLKEGQKEIRQEIDKRFVQIIVSIEHLSDKLENRDNNLRSFTMRMFSISIVISFLGVFGVFLKIFRVV